MWSRNWGLFFALRHPQGIRDLFLQNRLTAAQASPPHGTSPKAGRTFCPFLSLFSCKKYLSQSPLPASPYILHEQLVLVCLVLFWLLLKFAGSGNPLSPGQICLVGLPTCIPLASACSRLSLDQSLAKGMDIPSTGLNQSGFTSWGAGRIAIGADLGFSGQGSRIGC